MSLHGTLIAHWDAVEADFQRYYRLDIRQAENRGARRLLALLRGLPEEAATWRGNIWTLRDEMTAKTLEGIDWWGRHIAGALGMKDAGKSQPMQLVVAEARTAAIAPPKPKVETNPDVIQAFFAKTLGR